MPTAEQLARLLAIREAAASVALDGETMHVAAPDGGCCLEHARERIAELEAEVERLQRQLSQLTHDIDAKGRETYRCGFEDGYAKGAGSATNDDATE